MSLVRFFKLALDTGVTKHGFGRINTSALQLVMHKERPTRGNRTKRNHKNFHVRGQTLCFLGHKLPKALKICEKSDEWDFRRGTQSGAEVSEVSALTQNSRRHGYAEHHFFPKGFHHKCRM